MEIALREVGAGVLIRPLAPLHPPPHPHTEPTGGSLTRRLSLGDFSHHQSAAGGSHTGQRGMKRWN